MSESQQALVVPLAEALSGAQDRRHVPPSLPGSLSAPMHADTASFAACGSAAAALLLIHKASPPADEHLAAAFSRPPLQPEDAAVRRDRRRA